MESNRNKKLQYVVDSLASVDKSSISQEEVHVLLSQCFSCVDAIMVHSLHETYTMVRIRVNEDSKRFSSIQELSYRPKELNQRFQRASVPNATFFYASSCERRNVLMVQTTDIEWGMKVALFETLYELRPEIRSEIEINSGKDYYNRFSLDKLHRPNKIKGIEITYGIWEVINRIDLAQVCYKTTLPDDKQVDPFLRERFFGNYVLDDPYNRYNHDVFFDYLSSEFSKYWNPDIEDYEYIVSAIATQILCEMGFDGVSYPSVRCEGNGINFAIRPEIVDSKLKCTEVGLITVMTEKDELRIEYDNSIQIHEGQEDFDL